MKICWDNLEGLYLTRNGTFRKGSAIYIYRDACLKCGESFLTQKRKYNSPFCSRSCAISGKNNPFYGKVHTVDTKKKIATIQTGKIHTVEVKKRMSESRIGKNNPFFGKKHTVENKKKMSVVASKRVGVLHPQYKGGVHALGLTTYDTHKNVLGIYEEIRKQRGTEVLETKCVYCGRWFAPTYIAVSSRIRAVNTLKEGECRLYCSDECKDNCPTYKQYKYPKGFKKGTSREVSTYLRKLCFERDNWECQKCEAITNLHCHHINGYAQNKILANDIDNVITLCKNCHKEIHSKIGCKYTDLKCKPIKNKKE